MQNQILFESRNQFPRLAATVQNGACSDEFFKRDFVCNIHFPSSFLELYQL